MSQIVEYRQVTMDTYVELCEWLGEMMGDNVPHYSHDLHIVVRADEGAVVAFAGNWITRSADGSFGVHHGDVERTFPPLSEVAVA